MNTRLSVVVALWGTLLLCGALACSPSLQNQPGGNVAPADGTPTDQTPADRKVHPKK